MDIAMQAINTFQIFITYRLERYKMIVETNNYGFIKIDLEYIRKAKGLRQEKYTFQTQLIVVVKGRVLNLIINRYI